MKDFTEAAEKIAEQQVHSFHMNKGNVTSLAILSAKAGAEYGYNEAMKLLKDERNVLQNTASLMWHNPEEQKRTLYVAECIDVTIKYIEAFTKPLLNPPKQ